MLMKGYKEKRGGGGVIDVESNSRTVLNNCFSINDNRLDFSLRK